MSIIVRVDQAHESDKTQMAADVQAAASEGATDAASGNFSAKFANRLRSYSTQTVFYARGVSTSFDANIATSNRVDDIKQALDQFKKNLSPQPSSVITQFYKEAGNCEQWNAACLDLVESDYRQYRSQLDQIEQSYSAADRDVSAHTKSTTAVYVYPTFFWNTYGRWSGAVAQSRWGRGDTAKRRFAASKNLARDWQNACDAWRIRWNTRSAEQACSDDEVAEARPFDAQLRTDIYLSDRGLPTRTAMAQRHLERPSKECPRLNSVGPANARWCENSCPDSITQNMPWSTTGAKPGENPRDYGYGPAFLCCPGDSSGFRATGNAYSVWNLRCA